MLIEYYKKRNARLKGDICFYNGKGTNIILALGKPQEIDDQWGYRLLSENADIIRLVEMAPAPIPRDSVEPSSLDEGKKPKPKRRPSKK